MLQIFKNYKFTKEKSFYNELINIDNADGMYNVLDKLPNPDVLLRKTGKGIKTLRSLLSNYQVGTCVESRKAGVLSKKWRLDQGDCPDKEFEFWQDVFKYFDFHNFIENILETPLFGFVPFEIKYEKDGNYIVPLKAEAKPQEWFYFNQNGDLHFNTKNGNKLINTNSPKIIVAKHRANLLNPYGEALLSRCFWNVAFINGGMQFWSKFMEKYGMPFAVGKCDSSRPKEEKIALFTALKRMVQDAIAVIPTDGSVDLIEPNDKSGSSEIYENFIKKCENNISKVILGQTLTTDIGSSGSYAAANTHQQVREDLIQNDVRLCEKTCQDFINKVHAINFSDFNPPKLLIYDEEKIDQTLAERDNKLKTLGVKFTKAYIQKAYNLAEDDFHLDETAEENANFSDSADFENDFEKMEKVANNLKDVDEMFNPLLNPIITLFKETKNADECMERLAEVFPQMDTKKLEETLTKVIFIAELLGRTK